MSEALERRNQNVERVAMTTLVDICIQGDGESPFQAESANVSGRGMQVRTSYLPEIGDELVCRFEHDSREILVEGRVAWRAEGLDSGEFGIQFTALDATSADVLRGLRSNEHPVAEVRRTASRLFSLDDEESPAEEGWLASGDRVKLHIAGLAAPMKACVHDGSERKVRVGSSLEFLKVGRPLQIEDLEGGQSRGAHVDSVNVVLNPSTAVPELVVMLRYEGVSPTPPPARASVRPGAAPRAVAANAPDYDDAHFDGADDDVDAPDFVPERLKPAAEAIKQRLDGVFGSMKSVAQQAGGVVGRTVGSATETVKRLADKKPTRKPMASSGSVRHSGPRRTTAPPAHRRASLADAGVVARERTGSRATMRPQARSIPPTAPASDERRRRLGILGAIAVVGLGGSALLVRGLSSNEVAPSAALSATTAAPTSGPALPANAATAGAQPVVAVAPPAPAPPGGIVAEVPLFGARPVATAEAARAPATDVSDAAAEKMAAAAAVDDEAFAEEEPPAAPERAVEVPPWGRGKLYLPTVHRVRLDAAGSEIAGAVEAHGFTVVIPGRKTLESGRSIEKRDRRIAVAKASNTARGASIHFEFRGPVPAYRVRLKKDYVEFLISAPEEVAAR
jgi:hypothetical protein